MNKRLDNNSYWLLPDFSSVGVGEKQNVPLSRKFACEDQFVSLLSLSVEIDEKHSVAKLPG